jgi:hypothetical protein
LSFALACNDSPTDAGTVSLTDTYLLNSVDRQALPAHPEASGFWRVISGSLALRPNGYFVLTESDSSWNGRAFIREDYTNGGTWTADGAMLILNDTASGARDTYGAGVSSYFGTIGSRTVWLTIATDEDSKTHVFQYGQ